MKKNRLKYKRVAVIISVMNASHLIITEPVEASVAVLIAGNH
jgi:hypothetical protein